jgi:23S rRNA (pseudouridine1915-N3)-methyltransferase
MGYVRQLMGRITLHLHGQARERSYREMLDTYSQRLSVKNIKIISHSSKKSVQQYYDEINNNAILFILDENGVQYTSRQFAALVKTWTIATEEINLAIGPVDGWQQINHPSKRIISLSNMTLPHELAAVILAEQVYRATEIIKGTKYHRD